LCKGICDEENTKEDKKNGLINLLIRNHKKISDKTSCRELNGMAIVLRKDG
jgi:hypothetical protein